MGLTFSSISCAFMLLCGHTMPSKYIGFKVLIRCRTIKGLACFSVSQSVLGWSKNVQKQDALTFTCAIMICRQTKFTQSDKEQNNLLDS